LLHSGLKKATLAICLVLIACGDASSVSETELIGRANRNIAAGDLKAAVLDLKTVLQSAPNSPDVRFQLGKLYLELGNGASARKELEQARSLSSDDKALPLIARTMLMQGLYQDVTEMPSPAGLQPHDQADFLVSAALAWLALEDLPKAKKLIASAEELAGTDPYVGYARAMLLATEGQEHLAEDELVGVLKSHPQHAEAWALRGDIALRAGDLEKAEASGSISLNTLRKAAEALDCALVYAVVPRHSLQAAVEQQARKLAEHSAAYTGHSMLLENQLPDKHERQAALERAVADIVRHRPKNLWD